MELDITEEIIEDNEEDKEVKDINEYDLVFDGIEVDVEDMKEYPNLSVEVEVDDN